MSWTFLSVEIVALATFLIALREAWVRGTHQVSLLLAAVLFGLAIEVFFVTQYAGYSYGKFLVEIPLWTGKPIPLWVGLGWGAIIWTTRQAAGRVGGHWAIRAATGALLALSIDLTLDPVAEALGWWTWRPPGQFFGVPYDNFIGWLLIVGLYGLATRALFHYLPARKSRVRDLFIPFAAIPPTALCVAGAQLLLDKMYPLVGQPLVFLLLTALLLASVVRAVWNTRAEDSPAWFLLWIPAAYHGLMIVLLLFAGVGTQLPELFLFIPFAAFTSLLTFRYPRCNRAHPKA